jgi:predicted transcriptional regulator
MGSRAAKQVTISLSADMLEELDRVRTRDHRTRSEILREAVRRYLTDEPTRQIPIVHPEPGDLEALDHGRAQTARGEYVLLKDLLNDLDADRGKRRGEESQADPD